MKRALRDERFDTRKWRDKMDSHIYQLQHATQQILEALEKKPRKPEDVRVEIVPASSTSGAVDRQLTATHRLPFDNDVLWAQYFSKNYGLSERRSKLTQFLDQETKECDTMREFCRVALRTCFGRDRLDKMKW